MKILMVALTIILTIASGAAFSSNCAGRLLEIRPEFNSVALERSCFGTDHSCVIDLAQKRPGFNSVAIQRSCSMKYDLEFGSNCAGRLLEIRPEFNSVALERSCFGTDHSCVIDLAQKRPGFNFVALHRSCAW